MTSRAGSSCRTPRRSKVTATRIRRLARPAIGSEPRRSGSANSPPGASSSPVRAVISTGHWRSSSTVAGPIRRSSDAPAAAHRTHAAAQAASSISAIPGTYSDGEANAALDGRDHTLPDDVQALAEAVLAHRLLLAPEAVGSAPAAIVRDALARVPAV